MNTLRTLLGLLAFSSASCTLLTLNDLDAIRNSRDAGGTPQLVVDRPSLDFGLAPVGQISPAAILHITNTGTGPAGAFTAVLSGAGATSFAIGSTAACDALAAGASCDLSLTYTPSVSQLESATLTIAASPGGTSSLSLSGEGVVAGIIAVSPTLVDFGSVVQPGQSATLVFAVRNTGAVATGVLDTGIAGSDQLQFEVTADACAGVALAPGESCAISARFAPGLPGPRRASLRISGAPGGTGVATLLGNGLVGGGQLSLSPSARTLPNVAAGAQGAPVTFRVTNSGATTSGLISLELTGSGAPDFELLSTDCTFLAPTTGCNVQVRFRPASSGARVATLHASADPGGNATSSLAASAEAPAALAANPPAVDFGTVLTSSPSTTTITINNPGALPTGVLTAALTGQDAGVFTIVSGCNVALMPQQNCQLDLRFAPTADGAQTGSLVVSASPGGAVTVPLSGLGATPGALTLTPSGNAFGQVLSGAMSAPRVFTATNTGGTASSALSVNLTGTNANQYVTMTDQCSGMTLAPQASCDVSVVFAPNGGGSKSASLTVSATSGGTAISQLTGAGVLPAVLGLMPATADFLGAVGGQQGIAIDFDVTNGGDVATTAALVSALTGTGASSFVITGDGCATGTLGPGASCRVTVAFAPPAGVPGVKSATLEVRPSAGAGGTVSSSLTGTALNPSALTFDSQSFGAAQLSTQVDRTFTLTNGGGSASGGVSLAIGGSHASEFTVLSPVGTDCRDGGVPGGASCTVRVRWIPSARGTRSAQLTANANPGGPAVGALGGTGLQQATLSSVTTTASVGSTENGVATTAFSWNITNVGDLTSGVPAISKSGPNAAEFSATGCAGALDAGASCTVQVTLTPAAAGLRNTSLQVSASPGGAVTLAASGTGLSRLTVFKTDGGPGRIYTDSLAIDCGPTCFSQSALFNAGTVAIHARTSNGASAIFNGWGDGGCASYDSNRDCSLTTDVSKTVTAKFASRNFNTVFVSDLPVAHNLGALANYDALCNLLASDAGINSATNNSYVALMSNSSSSAATRLGTARGFERVDGRAIADTQSDLFTLNKIFNPVQVDQFGAKHEVAVMTGTNANGTSGLATETCTNWTTQASTVAFISGLTRGGPSVWIALNFSACDQPSHLYCAMNTRVAALTPAFTTGKRMWATTTPYVPGSQTPTAKCIAERPPGVGTNVKALVGRVNPGGQSAAAAALVAGTTYIRPDGQLIGTYDELISATGLQSGVWQTAALAYVASPVWTGFGDPNHLTDIPPADTCANWTSSSNALAGSGGSSWSADSRWFADYGEQCDHPNMRLICVEQ